jgi:Putative zinc- or iron-chelating domain
MLFMWASFYYEKSAHVGSRRSIIAGRHQPCGKHRSSAFVVQFAKGRFVNAPPMRVASDTAPPSRGRGAPSHPVSPSDTLRTDVPCNGCVACCRHELVLVLPGDGDDPTSYDCNIIETPAGQVHALKHRPNGDCIYLGPTGCSIWERTPTMCKIFDCRKLFLRFTRNERRRMPGAKQVFAAARARLP